MAEPRKSGFPGKNARATKTIKTVGSPPCDIDSMSIYFGDLRNVRLHNATKDAAGIGWNIFKIDRSLRHPKSSRAGAQGAVSIPMGLHQIDAVLDDLLAVHPHGGVEEAGVDVPVVLAVDVAAE